MLNKAQRIDDDLADFLAGGSFDPDYEFNMKKHALEKDLRINKTKFSNTDLAYKELKKYESSDAYKNIERAKQLLSSQWDTTNESLKSAMQRSYNLSDMEYSDVLEGLANSKDLDVRFSLFDKVVKIKKK